MKASKNIKSIQIFNQNNDLIYECTKHFSFPVKYVDNKPVDNVLMIKDKNLPELHRGAIVDVIINTRSGDRVKYFCQVDFSSNNQLNITLSPERARNLEERRRFFKIKTAINCRVVDLTRDGSTVTYKPHLYGKIYDINLGGVLIKAETAEAYKSGDILTFTTILGNNKLEASAKILRINTAKDGEISGYGCAFVSVDNAQEAMISSYVNYLQIEERRLELEREKLAKEIEEESRAGN
jgi:c-di-GMP-binding flagellar brake protein YcgR